MTECSLSAEHRWNFIEETVNMRVYCVLWILVILSWNPVVAHCELKFKHLLLIVYCTNDLLITLNLLIKSLMFLRLVLLLLVSCPVHFLDVNDLFICSSRSLKDCGVCRTAVVVKTFNVWFVLSKVCLTTWKLFDRGSGSDRPRYVQCISKFDLDFWGLTLTLKPIHVQKVKGHSVQKLEWKRTDEADCISSRNNAIGNYILSRAFF